jgi:HlyD family secretion protein
VWVLSGDTPRPVRVELGVNDGTSTAVTGGDLQEGARVVTGLAAGGPAQTSSSGSGSPLVPQRPRRSGSQAPAGGGGR